VGYFTIRGKIERMQLEYQTTLLANEPIAITIGNFDGFHRGHQLLMHELVLQARELDCKPVLVTFSPHTSMVVRPDADHQYLTTLEEKLALAQRYGHINNSIVVHFTPEVMQMSAEDFMDSLLTHFAIRGITVGSNFSLGHHRMGNVTFLEQYCQQHEIVLRSIALEEAEQTRISSTRIRTLVGEGQVSEANDLLGYPVTFSGLVVHGDHRGRLLGFPTANLAPEPHKLLPANGVYAAHVIVGADLSRPLERDSSSVFPVYKGVVNIGVRPTFQGQERRVEAHLLDVDLELYDQRITIDFIARLREEQRFSGIEALKAQISTDVQQARRVLVETSA
jgi:riboflavin kinase / FMN adenylyltransferase